MAKAGIHDKTTDNAIGLCETYVADLKVPSCSYFYSTLKRIVKGRCLVLIHLTAGEYDAGYVNSSSAEQKTDQSFPLIVINGKEKISVSQATPWQTDLSRLLESDLTVGKWKLGLYLSCRQSQEDKAIIDFSVCNMGKIKKFNGSFILWVAEMKTLGSGQKGWVVIKKLVEKKIKNLPPATTVGCSLPDQFPIPELSGTKKYCIISVVYDSDLSVQAVGQETVSKQ